MSGDPGGAPSRRLPALFVAAVMVVVVLGVAAVAAAVHTAAGPGSPDAVATAIATTDTGTPTPGITPTTATATPTSTPSSSTSSLPAPPDRCTGARFGNTLSALNPPADIHKYSAAPAMTIDTGRLYEAKIVTPKGTIVLCLDPQLAPITVNNFVTLARNHFYDGLTWHRVVAGFVIQGGDPQGTGSGGPGYTFADEPVKASYQVGAVAMANSGKDTNGSQFFICTGSQCPPLPPSYNLFGAVVTGQDVASTIVQGDLMTTVTVAASQ